MFTWINAHKAIAQKLLEYEDRQNELIEILRKAGETNLSDIDEDGSNIELEGIDPFTFFCFIYKYGPEKQTEQLRKIANHFGILPLPDDQNGMPSANAQKVWLFPVKKERVHNEIQRLWQFFKAALYDKISPEQFADILAIKNTGKAKITEGLFTIDPDRYLPLNAQTIPYLEDILDIDPVFSTWNEYLKILQKVQEKTDAPFYKISYDAWIWNTQQYVQTDYPVSEKKTYPLYELALVESLADMLSPAAVEMFYDSFDKLITRAGITPEQVHAGVRSDGRIAVTLGRRYVLMLKRKGAKLFWSMILQTKDEDYAKSVPGFTGTDVFINQDGTNTFILADFLVSMKDAAPKQELLWHKWLDASTAYYNDIKDTQLKQTYRRFTNEALIKSFFDLLYRKDVFTRASAFANYPPQKKLIEQYKVVLKVYGLANEAYKWKTLGQTLWNLEAADLTAMIKQIPFENLVYQLARPVLLRLADVYPEEL